MKQRGLNFTHLLQCVLFLLRSIKMVKCDPGANDVILTFGRDGRLRATPMHIYLHAEQMRLLNNKAMEDGNNNGIAGNNNGIAIHLQLLNRPNTITISLPLRHFQVGKQILASPNWAQADECVEQWLRENLALGRNKAKFLLMNNIKQQSGKRNKVLQKKWEIPLNIFLWNGTDRLVISDIDGTITRQDLMDILFPSMEWTQSGVHSLYTKIADQGYRLVYLTARPLSMASRTQKYLAKTGIPRGPVLLSPSTLLNNMGTMKRPTEYKAGCLKGLKELFPRQTRPLHAGMGNAASDKAAYQRVGIPYIFIVNRASEVTIHFGGKDGKEEQEELMMTAPIDYNRMAQNVQLFFPKI